MSSFASSPPPEKMQIPSAPPVPADNDDHSQTQTPLPPPPGYGVTGVLRRWRHEDVLKRGSLGLRALGFLFSLLAFIIMASNKHGSGRNFDEYEEYRYALAIAILSTLYTGLQSWRQIHEMSTGKRVISGGNLALIDFFGDQFVMVEYIVFQKLVLSGTFDHWVMKNMRPTERHEPQPDSESNDSNGM